VVPILTRRLEYELQSRKQNLSLMRNAVWTIANLCRGKPAPQFSLVSACIPALAKAVMSSDVEMLADACWAFNYLGDGAWRLARRADGGGRGLSARAGDD
jgi:hypothetical protein